MLAKKIAIAAIAGTALLAASGAYARHDGRWDGRHSYNSYNSGYRHYGYNSYRYAPRIVVRPAPVYYMPPAPVYYTPEPYYYEPSPVIYGRVPIGNGRIGFRLEF